MKRYFFDDYKPFKKVVEEQFLLAIMEVYKYHPVYKYDDDERKTNMVITPSYGNTTVDGKYPKMTTKVGSYNKELQDTLSNNFMDVVRNANGGVIGSKRFKIITVPLTVMIHAYTEEESSEIADELSDTVLFFAQGVFSRYGLLTKGAHISETDIYQGESGIYQTVVSFTFDVPWSYTRINENMVDGIIVGGTMVSPCEERGDDNTLGIEIDPNMYRSPGLTIFRQNMEDLKGKI